MTTKIVMISDTHTYHHDLDLPDGDILFHCGDFSLLGNPLEVMEFNDWLGTQKQFAHRVVIAGNHDHCVGEDPMFGYKQLTNAIYLQNSGIDLEGFYIWGSPMTPSFNGMRDGLTFFTNGDREAKNIWRGMPKKTDILMTHGPPFGILDEVERFERGETYRADELPIEHTGDKMLLSKVIQIKPKLHMFGHIHEGYGIFETDDTQPYGGCTFINASSVNPRYNLVNKELVMYI